MDRLKGKCILIGRNPMKSNLLIGVNINGKVYIDNIGLNGSVPITVSRCIPANQIAHCKIDIDGAGVMKLTNMKSENVTYIDNLEIMSKRIDRHSKVSLGRDKFMLDINEVLNVVSKIMDKALNVVPEIMDKELPPPSETVDISHLEIVWNEYEKDLEAIQIKQQDRAKKRMLPIMVSTFASVAAPFFAILFAAETLYITMPIAIVSLIMYIINYREKDTSIEDRKMAVDKLIENYVCPKCGCRHFLGYQSYRVLKQNKKCPYCGTLWKS